MKVTKQKNITSIQFQVAGEISNDVQQEEETQIINSYIEPLQGFNFYPIINPDLQKIKKKLIAFTIQYGVHNQKTTSIFLNYLQNTREVGINYLKNKDLIKAATLFADALGFIDPQYDEVFLQKFTVMKTDIINKFMFCIFELQNCQRTQFNYDAKRLQYALFTMEDFTQKIKQFSFYANLTKSQNCLLQVTYFYFGRLYRKKKKFKKAEQQFKIAIDIINQKTNAKVYAKSESLQNFVQNLKIKIFYKLSKCYREQKTQRTQAKQIQYEKLALSKARQFNKSLFIYLNRKIRFYRKKMQFQSKLTKLDGRKRIQQQVLKVIQQSKQVQIQSLYDVYLDELEQAF